jgi:superfamily I DNA/RNA helicase/RecB family exonuclease
VPSTSPVGYRLVLGPRAPVTPPLLDAAQQAVVEHARGPLVVLAGPGTGKTTTLVEAVAARVARGADPERLLVLTFSRKAAQELRDRITARLGRTTASPPAATFHSFCYALVGAYRLAEDPGVPLRLLSGTEQDVAVRELLAGSVPGGGWPRTVAACLNTRGLAEEVRDVIARSRERDVDLLELAAASEGEAAEIWRALSGFVEEYLDVMDARGVIDYAELVHRAVTLAESPAVRSELRARYDAVFVDEYQDSDPAQVRLLRALAGDGRDLMVFGDPDQSIYAFRGADVRGILDFPAAFRARSGRPAATVVLRSSRRAVPRLLAAGREVARRVPLTGLDAAAARAHRDLLPGVPGAGPSDGSLTVLTFGSVGAELEHVAEALRRAHLEDGLGWSEMAVLVRSGARSIPTVRRVLGSAGVPIQVSGDEIPLRLEPAVGVLLAALRVAAEPATLTAEGARALLLSPLAGADTADLRRLGRALRAEARSGGGERAGLSSAELLREAVTDPGRLDGHEDRAARPVRRLGALLADAGALLAAGGSVEDALWTLWDGSGWPRRLAEAAAAGSGGSARRADRDLDAVCALFDLAARAAGATPTRPAAERAGHGRVRTFLAEIEAQEIPGDGARPRAVEPDAVRVLTAHRSKGLEWPLVALVGVQEGVWPDLRRRGSLLAADRISPQGLAPPPPTSAVLAEERRLFYVAVTRAKRHLLVTAVSTPDEDGERPSRFLRELGVEPVAVRTRPARPLSTAGLVAELRSVLVDPATPPGLRTAAAERLATLANARDAAGRPLVPTASPDRWWATAAQTAAEHPVRDPDAPVALSGSAVAALASCPLRWFLQREARAETVSTSALGFGKVLHALADEVALGHVEADLDMVMKRLDSVWSELAFDAPWQSAQQRDAARDALRRFLAWHAGRADRTLLAGEAPFEVELEVGGHRVLLRGRFDRVEVDSDGRAYVVDFKTSKTPPSKAEVSRHPQLAVYQLAVGAGALAELPGAVRECGGAELVQLRHEDRTGHPKVLAQPALDSDPADPQWAEGLLAEAARRVLAEEFRPAPSEGCDRCEFRRSCSARAEGRQVIA